ncbi:SDR family NAD(P)-dependent oxidoreductase [Methanorbis furvi]|uniref:Cyclopentanol dehydrogenase n=1 Tax=Methanorbis furvi TaxID=3028299 RepID=A0AAE4MB74_9EURY|nr:Cyclopentanol dehydrogenase [Methanocorpusculaceae archaeon Ag1]
MRLEDKVTIVTGSTSGMGLVEAEVLAKEGAKVVVVGRNEKALKEVTETIIKNGGEAIGIRADITTAAGVQELFDKVMSTYGRVDVLVNNAGVFDKYTKLLDTSDELWDSIFTINLKSIYWLTKLVLPQMIERQSGAIVNIASVAGLVAGKGGASYTASKHAVIGLTKHMSSEYARFGIKINAICPGTIVTPLIADSVDNIPKDLVPTRCFGQPEEVADLCVFLASDEAKFMNGSIIPIDGGYTIQ